MIPLKPDALSPILSRTPIFLLKVESAHPGPWRPRPEGGDVRDVDLHVTVPDVYKGEVAPAPAPAAVRVTQARSASMRNPAAPGPWADADLSPGTEHVVFCTCPGEARLAELVRDACCGEVHPAGLAAFDLGAARDAGSAEDAPRKLLAAAFAAPARLGYLLPAYMAEAFGPRVIDDPAALAILARLLLARDLTPIATVALVRAAMDAYGRSARPPGADATLIRVMFRLLARENAAAMHANIADTYLPALIRPGSGPAGRRADEVFREQEGERAAARAAATRLPQAAPLLSWLNGSP